MNGIAIMVAACAVASSTPVDLVREGNALLTAGDAEGAIGKYAEAQPDRPNAPEIDIGLGLAHAAGEDHEAAANSFSAAASKGNGRLASIALFNLGNTRVAQARFEDAVNAYEDALKADPENEDARVNLEIVRKHMDDLKKAEEQRKKAEEEFKKRLEELVKELRELVELQSRALAQHWASEPSCEGATATEADAEELKKLAEEKKEPGEDLAARLARTLTRMRELEVEAVASPAMDATERGLAARAHKAAETASVLAAALRKAAGPPPPPSANQQGAPQREENPLIGALERAGGSAEQAAGSLNRASGALQVEGADGWRASEPHAAIALWRLIQALGELAKPPQGQQGQQDEALKELLKKMGELRRQQGLFVLDVWASIPDAQGHLPTPDEQKEFWQSIREGNEPSEEDRIPLGRLEIASTGKSGVASDGPGLAKMQRRLAEEALGLAAEAEALAAKSPQGAQAYGEVMGMLRSSAQAMEAAAGALDRAPVDGPQAETQAVTAFVRLSRAPGQLDELLARLGMLLASQTARVLDTWKSDAGARGPIPTARELEAAREAIAKAFAGEGALDEGLQAGIARATVKSIDDTSGGKLGQSLPNAEAAKRQTELVAMAREVVTDMGKLAGSGKPGEQNPAAAMLQSAAGNVEAAARHMEGAAAALPKSFVEGEPLQARAVYELMRALARFSSGAAQQGEQNEQREKKQGEKQEGQQQQEGKESREEQRNEGEEGGPEQAEEREHEDIGEKQAERLLEEASQEEREIRRNMRKRKGGKEVEVRWDW